MITFIVPVLYSYDGGHEEYGLLGCDTVVWCFSTFRKNELSYSTLRMEATTSSRNVGEYLPDYTESHPGTQYSSSYFLTVFYQSDFKQCHWNLTELWNWVDRTEALVSAWILGFHFPFPPKAIYFLDRNRDGHFLKICNCEFYKSLRVLQIIKYLTTNYHEKCTREIVTF
jgi:hypothetical protein